MHALLSPDTGVHWHQSPEHFSFGENRFKLVYRLLEIVTSQSESLPDYGNGRHELNTADKLDRHISETADMARSAMASLLSSLHGVARDCLPGDAMRTAGDMQATVRRMEEAMSSARHLIDDGDEASASIDCARVMALSDYATRMARLRAIAAQIEASSEEYKY